MHTDSHPFAGKVVYVSDAPRLAKKCIEDIGDVFRKKPVERTEEEVVRAHQASLLLVQLLRDPRSGVVMNKVDC